MKYLLLYSILIFSSCTLVKTWQKDYPDNVVEEVVEDIIKSKTGVDVDLTPVTGSERFKIRK